MYTPGQLAQAGQVLDAARARKIMIVTAESCTGGIVSGCLTAIAGAADVFDRGFITYSYDAKITQLGVKPDTLAAYGAVSAETASEMAVGALAHSTAQISLAVTGIAGPGGATADKPVGLVYIGIAHAGTGTAKTFRNVFSGDRSAVRSTTLDHALVLLTEEILSR